MNKKLVVLFFGAGLLMFFPVAALAIDPATWFQDIIYRLITVVIWPIMGGAAVIMFIYSGFLFVTAQGDPGKIATARKALLWAVIGVAVALVASSISFLINQILFG